MTELARTVYQKLRQVPLGSVTTYKYLAQASGTRSYQAVGQILKRNPYAPEVPCHRVVASDGTIGGFRGQRTGQDILDKVELLTQEGVSITNGKVNNFDQVVFRFE